MARPLERAGNEKPKPNDLQSRRGLLLGGYADVQSGELIPIVIGPGNVVGEVTVLFASPPPGS